MYGTYHHVPQRNQNFIIWTFISPFWFWTTFYASDTVSRYQETNFRITWRDFAIKNIICPAIYSLNIGGNKISNEKLLS